MVTLKRRTPNVTWELIDEGTQGLSVLAREFFYVETLKGFSQFSHSLIGDVKS